MPALQRINHEIVVQNSQTMADEDSSLCVLNNVPTYNTPQKDYSKEGPIYSLIKEEIDIYQTEDEMEYQKARKTPPRGGKRRRSESCNSEVLFRSPCKKRYSSKLKSPRLSMKAQKQKLADSQKAGARERRARSLGGTKSGRSFLKNRRDRRFSVSQSETSTFSDYGDDATAKRILENGNLGRTKELNGATYTFLGHKQLIIDPSNADDENSISSKGESTSLATTDPLDDGTANESFVESSQSTSTTSKLRKKLSLNRSIMEMRRPITDPVNEALQNSSVDSEEENQEFSLTLSPESKSGSSIIRKESSPSPPRTRKRKAVCRVSPLKSLTRQLGNLSVARATNVSPLRSKGRKVSTMSPLNGLTQELENCIRNGDYVEMCDSETETMSFTFETIQLLNEFEDSNQQENNQIFDKILTTVATTADEEEAPTIVENGVCSKEANPIEDPLHIDEANADDLPSTSKEDENATKKGSKRKSSVTKTSKGKKKRTNEDTSHADYSAVNEDFPSSTSKIKRSTKKVPKRKSTATETPKGDRKRSRKAESDKDSPHIDETELDADILSPTANGEMPATETPIAANVTSDAGPSTSRNERRSSSRLKPKQLNMRTSYWESDNSLSGEAAKLAENVDAAKKKAALSTATFNKLRDLVVELRHKVLPQHEIESCAGSIALSYRQQKEFLRHTPLNKGTYSPEEDKIIEKNWNDFCEDHDWDPENYKPFLLFKHGGHLIMSSLEERRKFVQFLANGLPNRPLCSVYTRFRTLYNKHDAAGSRYSAKEDAKIIAYMKHSAKPPEQKCSELAKVLNRSRISIWKRYTKLIDKSCRIEKKKRVLTKVEWDLPLVQEFITTLLDVTLSDEVTDLKNAFLPRCIWLKMEEKMQINYDVMQRFWDQKLHMQLFAPESISTNAIKIKLIKYMHMTKVSNSKEIKWDIVVQCFDGYTVPFLRNVFNHLTMNAYEILKTRVFSEIIKWLHGKKISELQYTVKDKCLPRISYKDKKAEFVAEDMSRLRLTPEQSEDD